MTKLSRVSLLLAANVTLVLVAGAGYTCAASSGSSNVSHSYHENANINPGSIVSVDPTKSNYVDPANINNDRRLLGVTVGNKQSLISIDPTDQTVQVATNGIVNTLVTSINGNISVGDEIAASPFDGVGMKASEGQNVIGYAESSFNSTSKGAQTENVKNKAGKTNQIMVGYVSLSVATGIDKADSSLSSLQRFAKSLTGHDVSTSRIIISLIIAFVAIISLITLIYASIYGSIVSIGRNPLARNAIFRALRSVIGMVILTTVVASLTIFLLLR